MVAALVRWFFGVLALVSVVVTRWSKYLFIIFITFSGCLYHG
jgi:hypothetical protein